jgi:hypothetical protein
MPPSHWPHGYQPVKDAEGNTVAGEFVPGEIEAVRLGTSLFLAGHGYNTIVKRLNESPWRPRKSDRWRLSTVRRMMNNDVYAGYVTYGDVRNPEPSDRFPVLWDEERYREILRERKRRHPGGSPPASPASGIVCCQRCGRKMTIATRRGVRRFRCTKHAEAGAGMHEACRHNRIEEEAVVTALEEALRKFAQDPAIMEAALEAALPDRTALREDVERARACVAEVEVRQDRLAAAVAAGALDIDATRRHNEVLAADLDAATASLEEAWSRLATMPDQDVQRRYMEELIAEPSLRGVPIETARAVLQRAGVRVYVEEREIVKIVFGGPCA